MRWPAGQRSNGRSMHFMAVVVALFQCDALTPTIRWPIGAGQRVRGGLRPCSVRPALSDRGDRSHPITPINSRHSRLLMPEFSSVTSSPFSIRRKHSTIWALIETEPRR